MGEQLQNEFQFSTNELNMKSKALTKQSVFATAKSEVVSNRLGV